VRRKPTAGSVLGTGDRRARDAVAISAPIPAGMGPLHFHRVAGVVLVHGVGGDEDRAVDADRDQVDQAVMPHLRCQRRASSAPRPHVQPGQLHGHPGSAEEAELWSPSSLREKLVKIGAKLAGHGRYVTFQMPLAISRRMFADILMLIAHLRAPPAPA
jgi:hypothetical protein